MWKVITLSYELKRGSQLEKNDNRMHDSFLRGTDRFIDIHLRRGLCTEHNRLVRIEVLVCYIRYEKVRERSSAEPVSQYPVHHRIGHDRHRDADGCD